RERHRARSTLVVVQVALALVLMVGSGLMIRTFLALLHVDAGFDPKDALTMRIAIPAAQIKDPAAVVQLEEGILDKIRAIPGVTSAGVTTVIPTEPGSYYQVYARDKNYQSVPPLRRMKFVSPGLLDAMRNRLVAGRDFTWTDTYQRRPVAMVSENLARELWQDPRLAIGKEIREDLKDPWREVIGVVSDEREEGLQQKAPAVAYYPLLMNDFEGNAAFVQRTVSYIVRSKRAGSQTLLDEVQKAVWAMNGNIPLANVRTLQEIYDRSLARTSFTLILLAVAGGMALLIGLVGIYGVISYSVSQRTREIGIRIALGAGRSEVTSLFLGHGFALALIGVACGLGAAAAASRALGSLLFGVSALDPLTYATVAAGIIAAVGAASYFPSLKATRVDPVQALRAD
ncbi:MAG TPA: FtsX-like permease family protein, partial [Bryobacteraceae bacterium]|nr:FtsX-like permease family protein [Bryobacteraceae bacterium]